MDVKIWIFGPAYECPNHYQVTGPPGELSSSYEDYAYLIPREQYERWQEIEAAWDGMQEEIAAVVKEKISLKAQERQRRSWAGVPW